MDLESIIQRFVDGEKLSVGERKFLLLSLTAGKEEMTRFRVSKAEKMLLVYEAKRSGATLSDYLRNLTIGQIKNSLMNGDQDDPENF
jgi:Mobilization protein NikA